VPAPNLFNNVAADNFLDLALWTSAVVDRHAPAPSTQPSAGLPLSTRSAMAPVASTHRAALVTMAIVALLP